MTTLVPASMIAAAVTPESYGAIGDGVTNDASALNAAAIAAGAWGQVFLNPAKTYRITASITPLTGQRWFGGGKITTANGYNFDAFNLVGKTDVTIEGLRGESGTLGVSYSTATARFVAAKSGSHRCRVIRCLTTGFQSAVQFNASTDCQALDNVIVTPYGWGINVQTDADFAEVRGNRISGAVNEHGIYVAGSSGNNVLGVKVLDNWVWGSTIDGVKVSYADDTLVRGNHSFLNGGEGVYVTVGANRTEVLGNQVYSNGGNGIIVYTGTAGDTIDRNRVIGNVSRKNDKNGISVTVAGTGTVSNTWVFDNDVDDNDQEATTTQYGIVLGGGASNTGSVVAGNRITNEPTGIVVASSVAGARLGQNVFAGNTANIADSGTGTVIEQETSGATAAVTDGATITHGHPKTPASVVCTASVAGEFVSVTARGASTFTVAIKKHDNTAGTSQTVFWRAVG